MAVQCSIHNCTFPGEPSAQVYPCGHEFHNTCLNSLMEDTDKRCLNRCPIDGRMILYFNMRDHEFRIRSFCGMRGLRNIQIAARNLKARLKWKIKEILKPETPEARVRASGVEGDLNIAATLGRLDEVRTYLQNHPITEEERNAAINHAYYHFDVILELLRNGPVSQRIRNDTVKRAFQENRDDIVLEIIRQGPVEDSARNAAVECAIENHQDDLVWRLLKQGIFRVNRYGRRGETRDTPEIVIKAAANRNKPLWITALLERTPLNNNVRLSEHARRRIYLSNAVRRMGILEAARAGNFGIMELLRDSRPIEEDKESIEDSDESSFRRESPKRFDLLIAAAKNDKTEVARLIGSEWEDSDCKEATEIAVELGHLDILRFLIENGPPLSERGRLWLVEKTMEGGHLNVVQYLLEMGLLDREVRCLTLVRASSIGRLDLVQALDNGNILTQARDYAAFQAVRMGHLNVVRALLANGSITAIGRLRCVKQTFANRRIDIAAALFRPIFPAIAAAGALAAAAYQTYSRFF